MPTFTTTSSRSDSAPATPPEGKFLPWVRLHPFAALIWIAISATFVYFFGFAQIFTDPALQGESVFHWAWRAWNPETNYEHAKLIPLIALGLVWFHRRELINAPKGSSSYGFLFLAIGFALYLVGARALQPRITLMALPFLLLGTVLYGLGPKVARVVLFPIAFLILMVPLNFIEQATFSLQFLITGAADFVCGLLGIKLYTIGTTLKAADGSFGFEIAEGCSGIRSLMAMVTLTAVYVHLTQDRLWKKGVVFASSVVFAIIGNVGRIVTIVLFARFIDPTIAGGIYHDYSAFIFFPIAVGAMVLTSKLLNLDFRSRPASGPSGSDTPPATHDF